MSTPPWGQDPQQQPVPPPPPSPGPYGQPASPYQPYDAPGGSPYGGSPYGGSPYGGYPTPRVTNGLAIASLVVSIGSIVVCCGFPGFVGAILGHVARKQIRQDPNQTGEGLALGGIVVGWLATGFAVVVTILYVVLIAAGVVAGESSSCSYDSDGVYVCD